jgi:thioesterase domain-containing protein
MSDAAADIMATVHATIPLSRQMEFQILKLDDEGINSFAPLAPNINIHGTGFAGSLYSLAILTAWSYATYLIAHHSVHAELVIGSGNIRYASPVDTAIECSCRAGKKEIADFIKMLTAGHRARLKLIVSVNRDKAVVDALMVATPKTDC